MITSPGPGRPGNQRSKGGILVGIFIGLLIGALCAVGAAWYFTRLALPGAIAPGEPPAPPSSPEAVEASPITLPGKPGAPGRNPSSISTRSCLRASGAAPVPSKPQADASEAPPADRLYLQAGAFEDPSEADNVKAQLALMGDRGECAARATERPRNRSGVRVGPFSSQSALERMRGEMASAGIKTSIVRQSAKP